MAWTMRPLRWPHIAALATVGILVAGVAFALPGDAGPTASPDAGPAAASGSGSAAPAPPADDDPNILPEQITATIGFHIIAIRDVDLHAGTFYADFYYWMVRKKVGNADKDKLVESVEFMNGQVSGNTDPIEQKDVGADLHYACWHAWGTFHFSPDLHYYPFDQQNLEIQVENTDLEREYLVYADDLPSYQRSAAPQRLWGLKDDVSIYQYEIARVERGETTSTYHTDFGDPKAEKAKSDYSRFTVRIVISRTFLPYFYKIMLPLLVILGVAYLVFWLPPREIGTASTLAITALLSCIAFQISVAQSLPDVGYLITSDKFFIMTYMLIFLALVQSLWTYRLFEHGQEEAAHRWDARGRWMYPALYLLAMGYLFADALILKSR